MKQWFLPEVPDLLGLLRKQAQLTTEGMEYFASWSHGASEFEPQVGESEHRADDAKREVRVALRAAFSTPLDPEDIYVLSERMDTVINSAKNIVREADLIALTPDHYMAEMAVHISAGQQCLESAFNTIGEDDDRAIRESDAAVRTVRNLERTYRVAMSELLAETNLREVMGRRELYRRYSRTGSAIEAVAERVWYAVVKSS